MDNAIQNLQEVYPISLFSLKTVHDCKSPLLVYRKNRQDIRHHGFYDNITKLRKTVMDILVKFIHLDYLPSNSNLSSSIISSKPDFI